MKQFRHKLNQRNDGGACESQRLIWREKPYGPHQGTHAINDGPDTLMDPTHFGNETPLFTVVTIVRNDLQNFLITERSVLEQDFPHVEWVVIDGGSTDGLPQRLEKMACPRLRFSSGPDAGIYDAMNKGIRAASGEFLIFMNAGDAFASPRLLSQVALGLGSADRPTDFFYGDALERSASGPFRLKRSRSARMIWYGMFTHHQAMGYRREIAARLEYDTSFKIAGDYEFTARFLMECQTTLRCDFPLCIFQKGGVSERNASRGRVENFRVQTQCLRVSRALAWGIKGVYIGAAGLRACAPALYSLVRHG